ncbi:ABC transporter substrate-binding protein [Gudongella sp. SC589]|uniref:ABC transporter substrate-binding protein n=1 Tax=Gudongella sp. SC589 TaxID=3385990 RepID=UPI00390476D8
MLGTKKNILILLLLVVTITLAGCSAGADPAAGEAEAGSMSKADNVEDRYKIEDKGETVTFDDGRGERIELKKNPERVVVLMNSFVDIWVENGGEMVGMVEDPNSVVPGTESVETVGRFGSISLEKVISLQPDLVILSSNSKSSTEMIQPLEDNGIPIMALTYEFKDDYFKISRLFALVNDRIDLYEKTAQNVEKDISEIIERVPDEDNPTVLILFATSKSVSARGSLSTLGEMLNDLKTVNIAERDTLMETTQFSMEQVIAEDPDYILVQTMGSDMEAITERLVSEVESNPAWSELSAVKNKNYVILPKDLYTYKANSRYGEAYEGLAKILYPEVFN